VIQENKNHGFGQANNIGISYALKQGAEYVFLLNQDAYFVGDCLEKLIAIHQKNKDYGVLSPVHLNGDKTKLDDTFNYFLTKNKKILDDCVLGNDRDKIYDIPFVNAAAWLISKNVLKKVGGFDPIFFHYGEDNNYCQRLKYHNLKVGISLENYVIHDREHRTKKIDLTTKDKLSLAERQIKMNLANVNLDFNKEFQRLFRLFMKSILYSILKPKKIIFNYSRFFLLKKIKDEVVISRKRNSNGGNFFL